MYLQHGLHEIFTAINSSVVLKRQLHETAYKTKTIGPDFITPKNIWETI
jgi:hypothetical protein